MITNKLSRLVQGGHWPTLAVEFFAVLLGILLALAVDEWRDERNARADELEILVAMNKDIIVSIAEVEDGLREIDLIKNGLIFLAAGSDGPGSTSEAHVLDSHIANGLWEMGVYAPEMNTYLELMNSGKLEVIDSIDIRRGLTKYERSLQLSLAWFRGVFDHQQNKLDQYLLNSVHMPQVLEAQARVRGDREFDLPVTAREDQAHLDLLENDLFQNHVAAKFSLTVEYERYTRDVLAELIELQELVVARIAVLEGS